MSTRVSVAGALGLASVLCLSTGAPVAAQDADCLASLWGLPFDAAELPDGWELSMVRAEPDLDSIGAHLAFYLVGPDLASVTVRLTCVTSVEAWRDARRRADAFNGVRAIAVAPIGDDTWGTRIPSSWNDGETVSIDIFWTSGDVLGNVSEYADVGEEANFNDLEDIALAYDALLE